jgi:hypothetical protein
MAARPISAIVKTNERRLKKLLSTDFTGGGPASSLLHSRPQRRLLQSLHRCPIERRLLGPRGCSSDTPAFAARHADVLRLRGRVAELDLKAAGKGPKGASGSTDIATLPAKDVLAMTDESELMDIATPLAQGVFAVFALSSRLVR